MPVPKRKRSRQRRDKRFANKAIALKSMAHCSHCSAPQLGHQACKECGFYKGRKVLATKADRRVKKAEKSTKSSMTSPEVAESQE